MEKGDNTNHFPDAGGKVGERRCGLEYVAEKGGRSASEFLLRWEKERKQEREKERERKGEQRRERDRGEVMKNDKQRKQRESEK